MLVRPWRRLRIFPHRMHCWLALALVLIAVTRPAATAPAAPTSAAPALAYPPAARGPVVDDYHGTKVADPYR